MGDIFLCKTHKHNKDSFPITITGVKPFKKGYLEMLNDFEVRYDEKLSMTISIFLNFMSDKNPAPKGLAAIHHMIVTKFSALRA